MKTMRVISFVLAVLLLAGSMAMAGSKSRLAKHDGWIVDELCADQNAKAKNMDWIVECDPETVPWVLWVDKTTAYEISNPEKIADFFGKKVRVVGTMGEDGRFSAGGANELE